MRAGGSPYSAAQVYEFLKNPEGKDIHHYVLQFLEEGTIDLVCLSTDLEMEHCDVIRATAGATGGMYSFCILHLNKKNPPEILRLV